MRRTLLCAVALLVFMGCHREVATGTYVNKADATQVIKMTPTPSMKNMFLGHFRDAQYAGVYTLTTDKGTKSGTFTFVLENKTQVGKYIFDPQEGENWTGTLNPSGSFTDAGGRVWVVEHQTDTVVIFDPKSESFQIIRLAGKNLGVRNAAIDSKGHYWFISSTTGKLGLIE